MDATTRETAGPPPAGARLRAGIVFGLACLLFAWAWWRTVSHTPIMAAPETHLPAANAYDVYVKAMKLVVGQPELDRATTVRARGIVSASDAAMLAEVNRPALELVRTGLDLEYVQPPAADPEQGASAFQFIELARVLALEAGVRAAQQDWNAAANARLDQLAFAEGLARGGGASAVSSGLYFLRLQRPNGADPFDRLTAVQLRAAIARLRRIAVRRVAFADVLMDEKWIQLYFRDKLLSDPNWRDKVNGIYGGTVAMRVQGLGSQAQLMMTNKRKIMQDYAEYMDRCIALARGASGAIPAYPSPPTDNVDRALAVDVAGVHTQLTQGELDDANLLLRLALRCYRLEHGAYPANLDALCPAYLDRLPTDPLGRAQAFTYTRTAGSYRLTSPAIPGASMANPSNPWSYPQY